MHMPSVYRCHACGNNGHWVVDCPKVAQHPDYFPGIDRDGCIECGARSHGRNSCPNRLTPCRACGSLHVDSTPSNCAFARSTGVTWVEFYSVKYNARYFVDAADPKSTPTWEVPYHPEDRVVWCCRRCKTLCDPNNAPAPQPVSIPEGGAVLALPGATPPALLPLPGASNAEPSQPKPFRDLCQHCGDARPSGIMSRRAMQRAAAAQQQQQQSAVTTNADAAAGAAASGTDVPAPAAPAQPAPAVA
jgi:hypothetical protein